MPLPKNRVLTQKELDDIHTAFNDHYGFPTGPTSHDEIQNSQVKIKWDRLSQMMADVQQQGSERIIGLYFAYGLDGQSFVLLIEYLYIGSDMRLHVIKKEEEVVTTRVKTDGTLENILPSVRKDLADRYFETVKAKDSSGTFRNLKDVGGQIGIYYLLFENWMKLIEHNGISVSNGHDLVVTCTSLDLSDSETVVPELKYRHMLALHFDGRLNNHPNTKRFENRGTDYGSLCPENCPKR